MSVSLIKSRQRIVDHGEVFTPLWMVEAMLDLVKGESEQINARFLEPACGSGNFLVQVLRRKLAAVELRYGKSAFEKSHYALLGMMCIYGIELLADNIAECRCNLLEVFAEYLQIGESDDLYQAASAVLAENLVHGDALTMRTHFCEPILFAEWSYLWRGKFKRRDFRLDVLTRTSSFGEEDLLATGDRGKHEIFTPVRDYRPMTVRQIAAAHKQTDQELA